MSFMERKAHINYIKRIGCPYIDSKYKESNISTMNNRVQNLEDEVKTQNKEISNLKSRIELTVFYFARLSLK